MTTVDEAFDDNVIYIALAHMKTVLSAGWCQKYFHIEDPKNGDRYCIHGALNTCKLNGTLGTKVITVLREAIAGPISHTREYWTKSDPIFWNDARGRTQQEVLDLMDKAMDIVKARSPILDIIGLDSE